MKTYLPLILCGELHTYSLVMFAVTMLSEELYLSPVRVSPNKEQNEKLLAKAEICKGSPLKFWPSTYIHRQEIYMQR